MDKIDEKTIEKAALLMTVNPVCRILISANGRYLTNDDGTYQTCKGHFELKGGKTKLLATCGEPCSFVTKTSRQFDDNVQTIIAVIHALTRAQQEVKDELSKS